MEIFQWLLLILFFLAGLAWIYFVAFAIWNRRK